MSRTCTALQRKSAHSSPWCTSTMQPGPALHHHLWCLAARSPQDTWPWLWEVGGSVWGETPTCSKHEESLECDEVQVKRIKSNYVRKLLTYELKPGVQWVQDGEHCMDHNCFCMSINKASGEEWQFLPSKWGWKFHLYCFFLRFVTSRNHWTKVWSNLNVRWPFSFSTELCRFIHTEAVRMHVYILTIRHRGSCKNWQSTPTSCHPTRNFGEGKEVHHHLPSNSLGD